MSMKTTISIAAVAIISNHNTEGLVLSDAD